MSGSMSNYLSKYVSWEVSKYMSHIGIILSECSKKNSGVTRSKMILLDFVWRKSRCSMTEGWFPVGSSLQQLIDASYSRAVFWLVTWIPHVYSFLFIEPRTGDIGIMGPYLEWLVVISSMGRSEDSRPKKTWLIMCFCIIICIECPFGSIRHCKTHPYVWNGLSSPPNVPFFGDWRFICTKSPMIFPWCNLAKMQSCFWLELPMFIG